MKDEKEMLRCDECGEVLKTGIPDQDSRGHVWCRNCGLVYNPNHPMGRGLSGLISFMISRGLNEHLENIRLTYKIEGLAKARIKVSKL